MLTLPEEILLLLLDDTTGRFLSPRIPGSPASRLARAAGDITSGPIARHYALAGAVLMELALRSKIDTDPEQLVLVDSSPTGEEILDRTLDRIVEGRAQDAQAWVSDLADHGAAIEEAALARLVERGIVRRVEKKILWVFKTRRYPTIDATEELEVKTRLLELLGSDEIPSPHDVVLICLVDTCGLFPEILGPSEAERLAPRIQQMRRLDLIGQALAHSLERLRFDLARAMSPPYV